MSSSSVPDMMAASAETNIVKQIRTRGGGEGKSTFSSFYAAAMHDGRVLVFARHRRVLALFAPVHRWEALEASAGDPRTQAGAPVGIDLVQYLS